MRWGKRPSSFILGVDGDGKWNKWDILVAEAYEIVQREKCGQCGLPRWICQNDSEDIQFKVHQDSCFAMQKKDDKETQLTKNDKKIPAGVVLRPEPYARDGRDLADFREPYYRAIAKRGEDPESA